jgi:hypothetical protein
MKYKISSIISACLVLTSFILLPSCQHEISITGQYDTVCFDTKIQPLIAAKCGRCHGGNTTGESVHPSLLTYDEIRNEVTPYHSGQSQLYSAILSLWDNPMPPDHALSLEERLLIRVWIDQGASWTHCAVDTSKYIPPPADTAAAWVNPYACFTRDIVPIFAAKCAVTGCHDAKTHKEGLNLTSYSKIISGIVPYNANSSRLYRAMNGQLEDPMPPSGSGISMSQAQKDTIRNWINRGAKDTVCGETCDTSNVTFAGSVMPLLQTACIDCHKTVAASWNVTLTSYAGVKNLVDDGRLMKVIQRTDLYPMPPSYGLSACKKKIIEIWVNAKAQNN